MLIVCQVGFLVYSTTISSFTHPQLVYFIFFGNSILASELRPNCDRILLQLAVQRANNTNTLFFRCLCIFCSDFKYNEDYILPDANFNSMLDSIMTLFQLFVGEAWNDVMEAAMNTGKTIPAVLYFVSYILMMTLLFTNLIIGKSSFFCGRSCQPWFVAGCGPRHQLPTVHPCLNCKASTWYASQLVVNSENSLIFGGAELFNFFVRYNLQWVRKY